VSERARATRLALAHRFRSNAPATDPPVPTALFVSVSVFCVCRRRYGHRDLETRGIINWAVERQRISEDQRLQPLWTLSDGNCLLHASLLGEHSADTVRCLGRARVSSLHPPLCARGVRGLAFRLNASARTVLLSTGWPASSDLRRMYGMR